MRRLPKAPFFGGVLASLVVAIAVSAMLAYSGVASGAARPATSAASNPANRVDTNALIAAQRSALPAATPGLAPLSGGEPNHGPLLFDFSSMLPGGGSQVPATLGNQQLDKVKVVGQALQFEVSNASRVMLPLPATVQASSFVTVIKVDLVSGAGAFTFTFHMDNQGDLQHAVQVYTNGTTEAALFDGPAGTRSLLRRTNQVPNLAGSTTLAIAVDGPSMRVWVNGMEAGTARDGTLSQGSMAFKAGAAAREDPFVMRLTDLKVYQPA